MPLRVDQDGQRAPLQDEHEGRPADDDDPEGGQETGKRHRVFEQ